MEEKEILYIAHQSKEQASIGQICRLLLRGITPLLLLILLLGCVEELPLEELPDNDGAGLLVVEAVLTDQLKTQEVLLSRSSSRVDLETDTTFVPLLPTLRGERDSVDWEQGARIVLRGGDGSQYDFTEALPGQYLSNSQFALSQGVDYELEIATGGQNYRSDPLRIAGVATVANVRAERMINDFGVEGIQIYADAIPGSGSASRLRYTYEETYKIIAPRWNELEFELTNYDPCALPVITYDLELIRREIERQVCYNTRPSDRIIQPQATSGSAGALTRQPIRFIPRDDFIITHRYSILVRQLVQSADAFGYYETLNNFSESQSLFSQIQPGALTANVTRTDGADEIVLGYVEAANASEQRIFFDYADFFPGEAPPPFPFFCGDRSAPDAHRSRCASGPFGGGCPLSLVENIDLDLITFTGINGEGIGSCPGTYTFVPKVCGDCRTLGDNVVPDFWEE